MSDKKCSAEKKAEMEDVITQVSDGGDDGELETLNLATRFVTLSS